DYLFVDEAGQVSVAHLVGMSHAASNLVLIGDQRQLEQPTQGSHPGESGLSCLTYLLQQQATIAAEQWFFLSHTRRWHPAICDFISRSYYAGRRTAYSVTERREVIPAATCRFVRKRAGIQFIPCSHQGNSNASPEEVEVVAALVE